jgi:hypothetical protein
VSTLWNETAGKFRKVTDRLGCPIDAGIFDTVVALNILGITTRMSCEGHLDHGLSHPWIDVHLSEPTDFYTPEMMQMSEDISKTKVRLYESYTPEMRQSQEEWERMRSGERLKLFSILSEFYRGRVVSFDRIITIDMRGRIQSQGGDYLSLLPESERVLRMKEYQQEMADFTVFLRGKISE